MQAGREAHADAGTGLAPGTYVENLGDGKSERALDIDPKPPEQELPATAPIEDQFPSENVPITQEEMPEASPLSSPVLLRWKRSPYTLQAP